MKTTRREWLSTIPKASRIDETVNAIAQYRLRSAYHNDKPYTAGDALYQFTRIPFGVTNGVACFQAELIASEKLQGTFAYLDNVTICGKTQEEHDENLKRFQNVATQRQITYNDAKSYSKTGWGRGNQT